MNPIKKNLLVDAVALVVYLIVANPALTGMSLHEWMGVGLLVLFVVHCAMHCDWIESTVKDTSTLTVARQGNLALDIVILVVFVIVTVSGVMVSAAILQAFGLYVDGYWLWDPLHSIAAKGLLALLLIHVVVHWKWLYRMVRRRGVDDGVIS